MHSTGLLRDARRRSGLTLAQVSALFGVTVQSWCDWERGARRLPVSRVRAVSEALRVSAAALIEHHCSSSVQQAYELGLWDADEPMERAGDRFSGRAALKGAR